MDKNMWKSNDSSLPGKILPKTRISYGNILEGVIVRSSSLFLLPYLLAVYLDFLFGAVAFVCHNDTSMRHEYVCSLSLVLLNKRGNTLLLIVDMDLQGMPFLPDIA
jgi:hypothetical protein